MITINKDISHANGGLIYNGDFNKHAFNYRMTWRAMPALHATANCYTLSNTGRPRMPVGLKISSTRSREKATKSR